MFSMKCTTLWRYTMYPGSLTLSDLNIEIDRQSDGAQISTHTMALYYQCPRILKYVQDFVLIHNFVVHNLQACNPLSNVADCSLGRRHQRLHRRSSTYPHTPWYYKFPRGLTLTQTSTSTAVQTVKQCSIWQFADEGDYAKWIMLNTINKCIKEPHHWILGYSMLSLTMTSFWKHQLAPYTIQSSAGHLSRWKGRGEGEDSVGCNL